MAERLPLNQRLATAGQLVVRTRLFYEIWWFYEGADTRPAIKHTGTKMPMAPAEEVLMFLREAHDNFPPLAKNLDFDKDHALHRTLMALYGSVLELTSSCILLIDKCLLPGVPVLLRAVLEAYVDLVNLAKAPRYGYALELNYLREWRKLLQEAKLGKNDI